MLVLFCLDSELLKELHKGVLLFMLVSSACGTGGSCHHTNPISHLWLDKIVLELTGTSVSYDAVCSQNVLDTSLKKNPDIYLNFHIPLFLSDTVCTDRLTGAEGSLL